ncbi:hypothetical protein PFLUV_G00092030 [Perca fluviatilis]|uniref:Uncharacterized protein n=1 Tax=Perca fluviatilis TaxID=8168 RepID=A0A6A5FCR3_PERFL|nr:hypothetical protein PFLUV_G00092030 [Perca fluviatilis]
MPFVPGYRHDVTLRSPKNTEKVEDQHMEEEETLWRVQKEGFGGVSLRFRFRPRRPLSGKEVWRSLFCSTPSNSLTPSNKHAIPRLQELLGLGAEGLYRSRDSEDAHAAHAEHIS